MTVIGAMLREAQVRSQRGRQAVVVIALGILLVLAGCTPKNTATPADGRSTAPTLRAPSVTPSSDVRAAAVQAALDAYRGMWAAYTTALREANPDTPGLAQFAADAALTTLVNGVKSVQKRGLRGKGEFVLAPQVTSLTPADRPIQAEIRDCADTSGTELYRPTPGPPYQDTPGGRRLVIATAKNIGDVWKVTGLGVREVGTC